MNEPELKFFMEDIQKENIVSICAVTLSSNNEKTITDDIPPFIVTTTFIPSCGVTTVEQQERIRTGLRMIGEVFREVNQAAADILKKENNKQT